MAVDAKITSKSLAKVLNNLNKEISKIEGRSLSGLVDAAFFVKNRAIKQTPIELGNLRASGYVVWKKGEKGSSGSFKQRDGKPSASTMSKLRSGHTAATSINKAKTIGKNNSTVTIGFSAFYSIYVHEINKNYRRGGWKFLESALKDNTKKILSIIAKRAKIK